MGVYLCVCVCVVCVRILYLLRGMYLCVFTCVLSGCAYMLCVDVVFCVLFVLCYAFMLCCVYVCMNSCDNFLEAPSHQFVVSLPPPSPPISSLFLRVGSRIKIILRIPKHKKKEERKREELSSFLIRK